MSKCPRRTMPGFLFVSAKRMRKNRFSTPSDLRLSKKCLCHFEERSDEKSYTGSRKISPFGRNDKYGLKDTLKPRSRGKSDGSFFTKPARPEGMPWSTRSLRERISHFQRRPRQPRRASRRAGPPAFWSIEAGWDFSRWHAFLAIS